MRVAIIENGKVTNVVMASSLPENGVPSGFANIGDTYDGERFIPPDIIPAAVDYKELARSALAANDIVAIRCIKAGVEYPAEWLSYDIALRDFIASGVGALPTRPPYPEGT